MDADVRQLVAHIKDNLHGLESAAPDNYEYASVPLCVIDAVFSIGVRYKSTQNAVTTFCKGNGWEMPRSETTVEHKVSDLIAILEPFKDHFEQVDVFQNRQRTSTRSGILKAEAVYLFAKALQDHGIETFADAMQHGKDPELREAIQCIPGQKSGLSFVYFLMLAGHRDVVKPDRMVRRFVARAIGEPSVSQDYADGLVVSASANLSAQFPNLTPSVLDNAIWNYEQKYKVSA